MARRAIPVPSGPPSRVFLVTAALALAAVIPALGLPVYFRTDDVHWLGWAAGHANPLAAFDPGENLFGYYRPVPTVLWWVLFRIFGFQPLGYQLALAAVAVAAMVPLYRLGARLGGGDFAGFLAVALFHAAFFPILYYVYWFSALTFGLEILFLLAALDAFTDGSRYPGRPVRFAVLALLAGLSKQPALVILPLVTTVLLWTRPDTPDSGAAGGADRGPAGSNPGRARLLWTIAIWGAGLALLAVTPFVVKRPGDLSAMSPGPLATFVKERYAFYAAQIVRSPAGILVPAAAAAALARKIGMRGRGAPALVLAGGVLGAALRVPPAPAAFPVWGAMVVAGAFAAPASLPWVVGFWAPLALLLGVDFHVGTYLLEPAAVLTPALVLWTAPLASPAGSRLAAWIDARPGGRLAALLPAALAALLVSGAYSRVAPVRTMRDVRAAFRLGVDRLIADAPPGATVGTLSYGELGESYADIRLRPLEVRVEQHKTMNPAQLEKYLRLRGRSDLHVLAVREAAAAPPPRLLFATNAAERRMLAVLPGAESEASFRRGEASTEIFTWNPPDTLFRLNLQPDPADKK